MQILSDKQKTSESHWEKNEDHFYLGVVCNCRMAFKSEFLNEVESKWKWHCRFPQNTRNVEQTNDIEIYSMYETNKTKNWSQRALRILFIAIFHVSRGGWIETIFHPCFFFSVAIDWLSHVSNGCVEILKWIEFMVVYLFFGVRIIKQVSDFYRLNFRHKVNLVSVYSCFSWD